MGYEVLNEIRAGDAGNGTHSRTVILSKDAGVEMRSLLLATFAAGPTFSQPGVTLQRVSSEEVSEDNPSWTVSLSADELSNLLDAIKAWQEEHPPVTG